MPKTHLTVSKVLTRCFVRKLHGRNEAGYATFLLKRFGFHRKTNRLSVRINNKPFPRRQIFL